MSTDLALYKLSDMQVMAEAVARSGLFGMKSPEQALALMLVAQSENQHPATVTQDYDIIQGKACRKTHSVMARFQQMGGRVEWHELTDQTADATFSHPAGGSLRIAWTFEQAKKAGLTNKDNWKNYPRAMLRARTIAEGVRAVYPAAIGGMMIAEEAQDAQIQPPQQQGQPSGAVFNGTAERVTELPPYLAADFERNLPTWRQAIADKKKTADQIIAMVSSKYVLSLDQKKEIHSCQSSAEAPDLFAQIKGQIEKATSQDVLDVAFDLVRDIEDSNLRDSLTAIYTSRSQEFGK